MENINKKQREDIMNIKKLQRAEMAVRYLMEDEGLEDFYYNYDGDYDFRKLGNILLRIETLENYRDDNELEENEEVELKRRLEYINNELEYFNELAKEEI